MATGFKGYSFPGLITGNQFLFPNLQTAKRDQLERASLSVVLNLAEGAGKLTIKDKRKFYAISLGSTREIQAIFDLLGEKDLFQKADILAASIYKLIQNTRTLDTI